jgi:ribosomal protein S27AE
LLEYGHTVRQSMTYMNLDSKILIQPKCYLVKVTKASLDGDLVSGVFDNEPQRLKNPISLCESFLNCRSHEDVLRFTKRYGLLFQKYGSLLQQASEIGATTKNLSFSFSIDEWYERQYDLKALWGAKTESGWSYAVGKDLDSNPIDEEFWLSPKGTEFRFANLYRLIQFFVHILPAERQRVCSRPDCGKFFYANHLKQTYCGSLECAHWGQLQSKKACWNRNKEKYLAQR